jgi:pilus assembly protein Flp/PilA
MKFINKLLRDEAGATAIEYGLIADLIAVAAITAMQSSATSSRTRSRPSAPSCRRRTTTPANSA